MMRRAQRTQRLLAGAGPLLLVVSMTVAIPRDDAVALSLITVTTTADVVSAVDGVVSPREAVSAAAPDADVSTITLVGRSTYLLNLCVGGTEEDANAGGDLDYMSGENLTIEVSGPGVATITQTCTGERVMEINAGFSSGTAVVLRGLVITGGDVTVPLGVNCDQAAGGGICALYTDLTLDDIV